MLHAGWPVFDFRQGQEVYLFFTASKPALGPTQPPIEWVQGGSYPGVTAAGMLH
jgi:hypothetical protein